MEGKIDAQGQKQPVGDARNKCKIFPNFQHDILGHRKGWYSSDPTKLLSGGKNWKGVFFFFYFEFSLKNACNFPSIGYALYSRINEGCIQKTE